MAKSKVIRIRISEEEETALQTSANGKGISLSEEMRRRLFVPHNDLVPQKKKAIVPTKPKNEGVFINKAGKEIPLIRKPKKGIYSAERRQSVKGSNKVDLSSLM